MADDNVFSGSLFGSELLRTSIRDMPDWQEIDESAIEAFAATATAIASGFPVDQSPNETQTEDDLIWPILRALGWDEFLRQQNLTVVGRDDVPDGLLFTDSVRKGLANAQPEEWRRYEFGTVIVESKRWRRPLDRRTSRRMEENTPSTQMLRYLRRVDDVTEGSVQWGVLTNGMRWRLYWQRARSVSEQYLDLDLAAILDIPGFNDGLFALSEAERRHWLKVFLVVFRRESFLPHPDHVTTFHDRALELGEFYQRRVADSLSDLVFGNVYPTIVRAIHTGDPAAPLYEVRDAALILLYRLLFILYAEDRNLLPVNDARYDDYGLRKRVRLDIKERLDQNDTFSDTANRYWSAIQDLCRSIDQGDASIGLPPYNGGLFEEARTPLLAAIRIGDSVMAEVIDAMSFEQTDRGRRYINYRDLSVQQLGSIYERLLEHEVRSDGEELDIRPSIFARKTSGSYYTPDDLVALILRETVLPLVDERIRAFEDKIATLGTGVEEEDRRMRALQAIDPAEAILALKICDPAMGSGHFLVSLVDMLSEQVLRAMADAAAMVPPEWGEYSSPLAARIDNIRVTIESNADNRGWVCDPAQLDDPHIVKRMVLKRCIYGVDKNLMAVELAKVSLWLHTFTVGAPLSFLDHHLRCGDSLFGSWVRTGIERAGSHGSPLLLHASISRAVRAASQMQVIEGLTDAEIAEAHRSADIFAEIEEMTAALNAFLSFVHAVDWLKLTESDDRDALRAFFDASLGDPVEIILGRTEPDTRRPDGARFAEILSAARLLTEEERFLSWQVAFPGVWRDWSETDLVGGFDAVVGNPPWDRMKMQQVEWFAARRREIAMCPKASDRKAMIRELGIAGDPLALDFEKADQRAKDGMRIARKSGDYPLLSKGDINLYSLFVERASCLVKPDGRVGLLTPSGIASDKYAAPFFRSVSTEGRLRALYDFENRRTRYNLAPFFPDVDSRFKFCVFVFSSNVTEARARCAFFLQSTLEVADPERYFELSAADFARVNPNTGTAPIFRSTRDADLTRAIYDRVPVLVDRSCGSANSSWPVRYETMFHMTNDSDKFRTRVELETAEGAWPVGNNRFDSATGEWVPLYVGRMINHYDHRAASVIVNEENTHNTALTLSTTDNEKANADFIPSPQYWVMESDLTLPPDFQWAIVFRDVARTTDVRTLIATIAPRSGFGNKVPLLRFERSAIQSQIGDLLVANLASLPLDYLVRQKVQSTNLNWYILEQLPILPPENFASRMFGPKSAAQIVREAVLELTYTANDLEGFARDMGHVDANGHVLPPFVWDVGRRLALRAKLDALFFQLYGVTDRDDIAYIYSTFPIQRRQEERAFGNFRSRDLCLAWMNALSAGQPDAEIVV